MKKSAEKKIYEAVPDTARVVMIITDGCFEAQADFSEFPDPRFLGILTESGIVVSQYDDKFEDVVLGEMNFF